MISFTEKKYFGSYAKIGIDPICFTLIATKYSGVIAPLSELAELEDAINHFRSLEDDVYENLRNAWISRRDNPVVKENIKWSLSKASSCFDTFGQKMLVDPENIKVHIRELIDNLESIEKEILKEVDKIR